MDVFDYPPIVLDVADYLKTLPEEKKVSIKSLLDNAGEFLLYASQRNGVPDIRAPAFRIALHDTPSAMGTTLSITLSSGLLDHCDNINPFSSHQFLPVLPPNLSDKELCSQSMLNWVVSHEWMHVIRKHNDVLENIGKDIEIKRALEYDADLCATALIYRMIQNDYGPYLHDEQIRQLALFALYWPIRHLDFYKVDEEHGPFSERLYYMFMKLINIGDPLATTPSSADKLVNDRLPRIILLSETLGLCERNYSLSYPSDEDYVDYRSEVVRLLTQEPTGACITWDEIRKDVARISGTIT